MNNQALVLAIVVALIPILGNMLAEFLRPRFPNAARIVDGLIPMAVTATKEAVAKQAAAQLPVPASVTHALENLPSKVGVAESVAREIVELIPKSKTKAEEATKKEDASGEK